LASNGIEAAYERYSVHYPNGRVFNPDFVAQVNDRRVVIELKRTRSEGCWCKLQNLIRHNPDGTKTPLTMPNHLRLKSSTLRTICSQAGIARNDFIRAYEKA